MNFRKPSKIQERALPLLLNDPPRNFIGQSQSGTGKTAAFVIDVLKRIDVADKRNQAIILSPSRELAHQIQVVVEQMGSLMPGLLVGAAVRPDSKPGRPPDYKRVDGQVLVGTVGTIAQLIKKRLLDSATIKVLVLDEADTLLEPKSARTDNIQNAQISQRADETEASAIRCQRYVMYSNCAFYHSKTCIGKS